LLSIDGEDPRYLKRKKDAFVSALSFIQRELSDASEGKGGRRSFPKTVIAAIKQTPPFAARRRGGEGRKNLLPLSIGSRLDSFRFREA